jgi:hypothetical protein
MTPPNQRFLNPKIRQAIEDLITSVPTRGTGAAVTAVVAEIEENMKELVSRQDCGSATNSLRSCISARWFFSRCHRGLSALKDGGLGQNPVPLLPQVPVLGTDVASRPAVNCNPTCRKLYDCMYTYMYMYTV